MASSALVVPVAELLRRPGTQRAVRVEVPADGLSAPTALVPEGEAVLVDVVLESLTDGITVDGDVRQDGRHVHDMYLFQVKGQKESTTPWDYYKLVAKVPGDQAFTSLAESKCSLVKK